MIFTSQKTGAVLLGTVTGQINSANAANLEKQMLELVDAGENNWVLDLSGLEYTSSAGLRVVLVLAKHIREQNGRLILCGLQPMVFEVFDISGFLAMLTVTDTQEQALEQLNKGQG